MVEIREERPADVLVIEFFVHFTIRTSHSVCLR